MPSMEGCRIKIKGIVQGVGFRPHVYRLASEMQLKGWVNNSSSGVTIEIEGEPNLLQAFVHRLTTEPPPLAVIEDVTITTIPHQGFADFTIRMSTSEETADVIISPDIAVCDDCKREVMDPSDRRYQYPFTNCTNCGPRFTIIKDVPYDRIMTTMADFPMCPQCQEEYENPLHRRFHAQPNACPVCGPKMTLLDNHGTTVDMQPADLLKMGYVLAVKGLG
ncbi:MAG: acylphosphatase, partial [Methylocystaceae bacterium]